MLKETVNFTVINSFLGLVLVAKTNIGICALMISDTKESLLQELRSSFKRLELVENKELDPLAYQVMRNIELKIPCEFPLDMRGTDFQLKVWNLLKQIPLGKTVSYEDLSIQLQMSKGARAIAKACGSNKISLLIPCHRVIRKNGNISGYRWGVSRKEQLLNLEKINL